MMNEEITKRIVYEIDKPDVMTVNGFGRIEYFEFESDIWIMDVFADKRGAGMKLARVFINYAKSVGKDIYGQVKPEDNVTTMDIKRLTRWYKRLGAKPIKMMNHPTAMKLEIQNG